MQMFEAEKLAEYLKSPKLTDEILDYERTQPRQKARNYICTEELLDFFVFYNPKLERPMMIFKTEFGKKTDLVVYDVLNPEFPNQIEYQNIGIFQMSSSDNTINLDFIDLENNILNEADYKCIGIGTVLFNLCQHIAANKGITNLEVRAGPIGSLFTEEIIPIYKKWGFKLTDPSTYMASDVPMKKELNSNDIEILENTSLSELGILPLDALNEETLQTLAITTQENFSNKASYKTTPLNSAFFCGPTF